MQQNSLNSKVRRNEISVLNVLLCLMVIFIHIISYAVSAFGADTLKYNLVMFPWRASSIAVQGFILLSGVKFFLTGKDRVPYGKYLVSRLKAIIIPYVIAFVVYYVFYYAVYDYPLDLKFILNHLFLGSLVCHLYFIPLILQFDLLAPLWKKLVNKVSGVLVVPFCFLLWRILGTYLPNIINITFPEYNFIYNDRIFTNYLFYWIIGCYIGKNYDGFLKIIKENFSFCIVAFAISFVFFGYYSYLSFNGLTYIPFMNQVHDFYVICALVLLYGLAIKYGSHLIRRIKLLSLVDRASYSIYLWHMLVLFGVNYVIEKLGIMSQGVALIIRIALVYPVTIALCILIYKIKSRLKPKKSA